MSIDKAYMRVIIHKLIEDIKAKETDYAINGLKVQISLSYEEAKVLFDALAESEVKNESSNTL